MIKIPGYQVVEKLYESAGSSIYRSRRDRDNRPIILKILKGEYPAPEQIARFKLEYAIARNLNLEGTVRAYGLEKYNNTLAMLLEDFGGDSLKTIMQSHNFTLEEFLSLALRLAEILGALHQQHVIHKDINPSNIVYNPATAQLKIIDFGISTVFSQETPSLGNPNVLEGTLAYMSPEQTGRINRALDYRTDFYSLGATFYEMLTHQLPFEANDAMELVHCHLAKMPAPPHIVNPDIPKIISDIVIKLLAKTAEDRYQSAWGIKSDLEKCLCQLKSNQTIAYFPLGRGDISDKLQISQKLYGRQREIETLLAALERVNSGKSEMMLVSGASGIGKSALVQEIYKPMARQRGYFISGKFNQLQRHIPYSALIQAFTELIQQLLSESEASIAAWREKLQAALGVNGQIIVDVIPKVELIVGKQPSVLELGPKEARNRFNLVFKNFIKVFTKPEHPLIFFLDDLQWADSASLKLIERLMTAPDRQYLLLLGAYRDVEEGHSLKLTLDEIEKAGVIAHHLSLAPLGLSEVNQLIADTLACSIEKALPLAEVVFRQTAGNPLFISEFLKTLWAERLLKFDCDRKEWQWQLYPIQEANITVNAIELIAIAIQKLPVSTQQVLSLAACLGYQFPLKTLAMIRGKSQKETADELLPAIEAGLILPIGNDYKFLAVEAETWFLPQYKFAGDRIQQAAYSLIPGNTKQTVHQQIGYLLLKNTSLDKLEDNIFEIVRHLNGGIEIITSQTEKNELAQLNLIAAKKAQALAAYQPALNYLQVGIGLLAADNWHQQYHLTLSLYQQAAEVAYLNGDFAQLEAFVETVLSRAKTLLDQVKVYEVKIQAYNDRSQFTEAINIGLEVLKLLGVRLPEKPSKFDVIWGMLRTKFAIGHRAIASFIDLPHMSDAYQLAAMRILSKIATAAFSAAPLLMPLIAFKQVNLSLKWGNAPESAFAYSCYGLILCGGFGEIETGYQFGQLALNLLSKLNGRELQAKTEVLVCAFIKHWVEPVKETLIPLRKAYAVGMETGDLESAACAAFNYCYNALTSGQPLEQIQSEMATYICAAREMGQKRIVDFYEIFYQVVMNLMGLGKNACYLIGTDGDESRNDPQALFSLHVEKLMLCFLFGEEVQAIAHAELAEKYLDAFTGHLAIIHFYFYDSLARFAAATNAPKTEQKRFLKKIRNNLKKIKKWARHAPRDRLHKLYLLEAERYRIMRDNGKAMEMYKKAIDLAKANNYIHEEALANELAAKFYLALGQEKVAAVYMQDARYGYQLWGATAKVKDLEKRYPELLSGKSSSTEINAIAASSTASTLAVATIVKATNALFEEIVLDKLLERLMNVLIENAGAQKGFLILENRGKVSIEAEGSVDKDSVTVLQQIPVENCQNISGAIANYVARTLETVVINDAARDGKFANDPYILERQPKSILCAPLLKGDRLIGIIYLENNLTTGAFTRDRLEVLNLLSAQAAISIENAKLYTALRQSESRLAQFLEDVPVGIFVQDTNGQLYYANRRAIHLAGKAIVPLTSAEEIADSHKIYVTGTSQEYPVEQLPGFRALKGENTTIDNIEIHQPDKIVPVEAWGTPIYDEKGNISYGIVAFQDITDRKKAETERKKFTHELYEINEAYERFVPGEFLYFLNKKSITDVQLGDHVLKEMTILFADIRSFSTLSEKMTPEENFRFINSYLSRMEPAIIKNHGFVDKYIGDAIMALFSGGADDALKAGISMLNRLHEYNQHRANCAYDPIQIGIGINTGSLMLGTVGGHARMDGTVISDAVNLASRLESLTKDYGVSMLISHHTFWDLRDSNQYAIRIVDRVKVKGKSEMVSVFEVFDADPPAVREGKLETKTTFEEALMLYYMNRFRDAAIGFEKCLRLNPMDKVAQIYQERCQHILG